MQDNGKTLMTRISFIFHADSRILSIFENTFPSRCFVFRNAFKRLRRLTRWIYIFEFKISASPPPQTACHLYFPSFEKANRASFHLWRCESSKQRRFSFQSSTLPSDPFVPDSNSPCSSCFIKKHFYLVFALESLMNVVERVSLQTSSSSPFVNRYQKLLQMWCFLPFKSFARINYADKCFSRV